MNAVDFVALAEEGAHHGLVSRSAPDLTR